MSRLHVVAASALAVLLAACPDRDATPGLRDPADPTVRQEPATPAPPVDAPPTTPAGDPALAGGLPPGVTAQNVQEGHRVFHGQGLCFSCHGQNGAGTQLAPALNDQQWINLREGTYDEIIQLIRTGVPRPVEHTAMMPPMGGAQLSEGELRAVAAYVFALSRGVEGTP